MNYIAGFVINFCAAISFLTPDLEHAGVFIMPISELSIRSFFTVHLCCVISQL